MNIMDEPTRYELLQEALRVTNLSEAEALRKKFMHIRNQGTKAWHKFVGDVEFYRETKIQLT